MAFGFFGKKKEKKQDVVVTTKKELDEAIKRKEPTIVVKGELVKQLKWKNNISKVSAVAVAGVILAVAATMAFPASAPITASFMSVAAAEGGAAAGGATFASIAVCAAGLSVVAIVALLKDYDIEISKGDGSATLKLKKGRSA